jgi:hypothetical protein
MFFMFEVGTDVGSGGALLCFCVKFTLLWLFFDDADDADVNADENDSGDGDGVSVPAADDEDVSGVVCASGCIDLAAAAGVNGCRDDDDGGDVVVDEDDLTDACRCLVCLMDDADDKGAGGGVDLI